MQKTSGIFAKDEVSLHNFNTDYDLINRKMGALNNVLVFFFLNKTTNVRVCKNRRYKDEKGKKKTTRSHFVKGQKVVYYQYEH
ncbi:MAG: hypothetical protein PHO86_05355 [Bacilli bacterium]|nr:hypothetical protein [Bacilli bacterium]